MAGKYILQARIAGSIWQGVYCLKDPSNLPLMATMGPDTSDSGENRRAASAGVMLQSLAKPEGKAGLHNSRPFARREGLVLGTSVQRHAQSTFMAML